ncbi:MAG: hypothetical protein ACYCVB_19865, partial [Bacilli bacterium]
WNHCACIEDFITAPLECSLTYRERTLGPHSWLASLHCAGLTCPLFEQDLGEVEQDPEEKATGLWHVAP